MDLQDMNNANEDDLKKQLEDFIRESNIYLIYLANTRKCYVDK